METQLVSGREMPPEDRDFYVEMGVSTALALAIVLIA